jgi:hypothetical protein
MDEKEQGEATCLFVGNIPFDYSEEDGMCLSELRNLVTVLFERYGSVRKINVPYDKILRRNKG